MGYDFIVKPFHGDFVNLEQGTGVVHIAPGHGDDDYVLGIENNVDIIQTVQDDGKYNQYAVGFEGEHIYKVDHKIADKLEEFSKLLFKLKIFIIFSQSLFEVSSLIELLWL